MAMWRRQAQDFVIRCDVELHPAPHGFICHSATGAKEVKDPVSPTFNPNDCISHDFRYPSVKVVMASAEEVVNIN